MKEIQSDVSWDELFMKHVYLIASKSKDPRTKIGAVLVKDGIIISEGYNGFARGVRDLEERYSDSTIKYAFVVHAEANGVLNAVRHGINTSGATCFTQMIPCSECAKILIQAGIQEIVVHSRWVYKNPQWEKAMKITKIMCGEAGVVIRDFDKFLSIQTLADGRIISV